MSCTTTRVYNKKPAPDIVGAARIAELEARVKSQAAALHAQDAEYVALCEKE